MKILLTGSHGFVGSNLIESLSTEHDVIRWDARVDKPLPKVDAVIHLAGLAHDTKHTIEAEAYFKVNTHLTQQLYDRFLESSAKKFVFFSSIKAQDGDTPYAQSKKMAEEYIIGKMSKKTYILRPCMIHGKGNKGNLNLLVKWVKKGLPWPLAAFGNKRSFASMGNVAYVVSEFLMNNVGSGIYNICDDEPVSTNELIELICECMGKKAHMWRIPQGLMKSFAMIGDAIHLPLNSERLGKLTDDYVVDNQKIKQVLGIDKMPLNARDGLRQTVLCMVNEMDEK